MIVSLEQSYMIIDHLKVRDTMGPKYIRNLISRPLKLKLDTIFMNFYASLGFCEGSDVSRLVK